MTLTLSKPCVVLAGTVPAAGASAGTSKVSVAAYDAQSARSSPARARTRVVLTKCRPAVSIGTGRQSWTCTGCAS